MRLRKIICPNEVECNGTVGPEMSFFVKKDFAYPYDTSIQFLPRWSEGLPKSEPEVDQPLRDLIRFEAVTVNAKSGSEIFIGLQNRQYPIQPTHSKRDCYVCILVPRATILESKLVR